MICEQMQNGLNEVDNLPESDFLGTNVKHES